jgi:hypothetical protein
MVGLGKLGVAAIWGEQRPKVLLLATVRLVPEAEIEPLTGP